ncbi:protein of unknown function [Cyclobacterium lianum]|uniref:DUF4202 domain-containing protein n=1 Tax=Cyclobacterium lianum TaxID=388280 RepID=A0A1M7Q981_9BACT|nr:DUF4202 domain-containing protein [Cyclobacterium lianum]SHN27145.1 protein of unknown function [Cyclobacterium lianum]
MHDKVGFNPDGFRFEFRLILVHLIAKKHNIMTNNTKDRLKKTLAAFDAVNGEDPNQELVNGQPVPKELIYGIRMSEMLEEAYPDSGELLRLAARSQHIRRWAIPREEYPMDRKGYLLWRTRLKQYHGEIAGEIMQQNGYGADEIKKVVDLLNKRKLKTEPDTQVLEDVICLVFLKYYFDPFINKHEDTKLVSILQKTWNKMSEKGRQLALSMPHSSQAKRLLQMALNP